MKLTLVRQKITGDALRGTLYIDGVYFCNVLERVGVEVPALWYTVSVTRSPRFGRLLPIVNNVPSRSGIRFHIGTKPQHSAGCILVPSREKEKQLTDLLLQTQQNNETIYLEIIAPAPPAPLYDVPCPPHERMCYLESLHRPCHQRQHTAHHTPHGQPLSAGQHCGA